MTKTFSALRATLAALGLAILVACGGGSEEVKIPTTVAEASVAYGSARSFLCSYRDQGCPRVNPDTVVTWGSEYQTGPVVVTYRGNKVFEEDISRVYYFVDHGFTSTGVYALIVASVHFGASAHVFINGTLLNFAGTNDFAGVDVREYSPDWLIVRTERYYLSAGCGFLMLNIRTGAQVQFTGTDEEMQQACAMK